MPEKFWLLVVLVFCIVAFGRIVARQRKKGAWSLFAEANAMRYLQDTSSGTSMIVGRWRGVETTLAQQPDQKGGPLATTATVSARFSVPMPAGLEITTEGAASKWIASLGRQEIEVQDAELDALLYIQGQDVDRVRRLLTAPPMREILMELFSEHPRARIGVRGLEWTVSPSPSDQASLAAQLDAVAAVASAIETTLRSLDGEDPAGPTEEQSRFSPLSMKRVRVSPEPVVLELESPPVPPPLPSLLPQAPAVEDDVAPVATPEPPLPVTTTPVDEIPASVLIRLCDTSVPATERRSLAKTHHGSVLRTSLDVERLTWTNGPDTPAKLAGGRTVIGRAPGGGAIAVRFAQADEGRVSSLSWGEKVEVAGVLTGWDDFYGHVVVDDLAGEV
jgi:hypothetical protein